MQTPRVKITRNGDTFTYHHLSAPAPVPFSLSAVCEAAHVDHEAIGRALAVVVFLRDSLESMAESGHQIDESGMLGLVSIFESVATILTGGDSPHNCYMEHQIIKAVAAGEV